MTPAQTKVPDRLGSVQRSAAQVRIITAALDLFGEHGVNGTSLQMIADALGVTKAAIYHQFPAKDDIVLAAIEVELVKLEASLDAVEAEDLARARELVLAQVIDLAVERRSMVSAVQHDPVVIRLLSKHAPFRQLMDRLSTVLTGDAPDVDARVRAAMVSAAIGGAVTHPLVADLDDEHAASAAAHPVLAPPRPARLSTSDAQRDLQLEGRLPPLPSDAVEARPAPRPRCGPSQWCASWCARRCRGSWR